MNETTDIAADYRTQGYVVVPGLVDPLTIDRLMEHYQRRILPSGSRFFRQNTNRYEKNRLTEHGHVEQSFLDVHNYKTYPDFRRAVLDVYFSPALLATLTRLTGSPRHNLMQTMLFDANTGTPPHQDWWYLDSVPNGHLLACWIALEDIHEKAGRFFVMAGTQDVRLHEPGLPHSAWLERMRTYVDAHPEEMHVPALRKGDVLFWNSRTIHGSLPTQDRHYSRRSLTAHFLPSEMAFGNLFASKPWVRYEEIEGQLCFANQPEYSLKAQVVSRVKTALYDSPALLKIARRFQRSSISELR